MSLESGIIEEILEEFDSVESIEDDAKSDKSKMNEDGERIGRTYDSKKRDNGLNGATCVHEDNTDIAECRCRVVIMDDINPKDFLVIEEYSNTLAENIVQEAVLINEIYTRDRKSGTSKPAIDLPMNKDKLLGQMEAKSPGYDQYIIDKFLHSQADPLDTEDDVGFDGKEQYFRSELESEETYPGLNEEDSYIQGQISRSLPDEESDKNNNRLSGNLIDPFNEALQTIHEGEMLVIEEDFRQNGAPEMTSSVNDVRDASPKENEVTRGLDEGENKVNTHQDILQDETQTPSQHVAFAEEAQPECRESRISEADDASEASDVNDAGELPVERPEVMEGLLEEEDEEEEEDGEPDCCEMTFREKKALVRAVRTGDIELFEKLMEKKNADIDIKWYGESLLMVAIRSGQLIMAEFLVDNGVDRYHRHKLVEREANGGFSVHFIDARQMAYDTGMHELVEFLDFKANSLFPFIRPKLRDPHLRQPIAPFIPPALDEAMPIEMFIDPDEVVKLIAEERKRLAAEKIARELEMAEMRIKARKGKLANVENESVHNEMESNSLNDELSQVFGPDVGFDNMHPGSLLVKHDYNIPDMTKHVSVRGTRSSHLARQVNTNKAERLRLERNEPKRGTKEGEVETSILLNSVHKSDLSHVKSRRLPHPHSAPQLRNYKLESIPDRPVRIGMPFIHGEDRQMQTPDLLARLPSAPRVSHSRSKSAKSAHSTISPFSQVAKLLEQSRLFSPFAQNNSQSSSARFPSIKQNRNQNNVNLTKTKINYIYADRHSAKIRCGLPQSSHTVLDLLPKRKLKC